MFIPQLMMTLLGSFLIYFTVFHLHVSYISVCTSFLICIVAYITIISFYIGHFLFFYFNIDSMFMPIYSISCLVCLDLSQLPLNMTWLGVAHFALFHVFELLLYQCIVSHFMQLFVYFHMVLSYLQRYSCTYTRANYFCFRIRVFFTFFFIVLSRRLAACYIFCVFMLIICVLLIL